MRDKGRDKESGKKKILEKLKEIGINPDDRPQNLNVADIVKISAALF